jgi:hypothetical protein
MSEWLFGLSSITSQLPTDVSAMRFHYALRHGSMKGLYAPGEIDGKGPTNKMSFTSSPLGRGTL